MTMVKAIEFETYTFDANHGKVAETWLVPDGDYIYYAIAGQKFTRELVSEKYFDFDFAKKVRIPNWLPNTMATMMIEDDSEMYRTEYYEIDMENGYGTISTDEMNGDY